MALFRNIQPMILTLDPSENQSILFIKKRVLSFEPEMIRRWISDKNVSREQLQANSTLHDWTDTGNSKRGLWREQKKGNVNYRSLILSKVSRTAKARNTLSPSNSVFQLEYWHDIIALYDLI